ncbi:MAG: hypothetical protein M3378_02810 [Actinomycetota bacterium]|nr:hypothetical protein [Actinomycetota bacterium]MDQ3679473.1 hypothetical protein [Actinomycetota bacterium]
MEHEEGDGFEVSGGLTRREAMRRGVVAGGALLWVTPMVQTVGMSRAGAQQASPPGGQLRGISFIEFRFNCNGTAYYAKVESINSATQYQCEGPNNGQTCGVSDAGAQDGCGRFTLSDLVYDDGDLVRLTVDLACGAGRTGTFVAGQSKCAGDCVAAAVVDADTRLFFGCPR